VARTTHRSRGLSDRRITSLIPKQVSAGITRQPDIRQSRDSPRRPRSAADADQVRVARWHELACNAGADDAAAKALPIAWLVPARQCPGAAALIDRAFLVFEGDLVDAEVLGNPMHIQKAEDEQHDGYEADERKHT